MVIKRLLRPDRQRKIPARFSWVDQRLVRDNCLQQCEPPAWALYLFLVIVADAQGLSFYSEQSIGRYLSLDANALACARRQLQQAHLIAYEKPLYQVLDLELAVSAEPASPRNSSGQPEPIGQILQRILRAKP